MSYIKGINRNQLLLLPPSLDEMIEEESPVRIIDAFVDAIDIKQAGFDKSLPAERGRPPYDPSDLLKLYIYGYMNRIRTSRKLERECTRNIELMWLMNNLRPSARSIAYFRSDNKKALKQVFRQFVVMIKNWDLFGKNLLAVDGSKLRAVNSKKNNYNQRKIERHLALIDKKTEEYLNKLDENDKKDHGNRNVKVKEVLNQLKLRREKYEQLEKKLKETGKDQVSTTDPEARQLIIRGQITEVAYNVQATVDSKHNLIADVKATNTNDRKLLGVMGKRAKAILGHNNFDFLADKGYFNQEEIYLCSKEGITPYVAVQDVGHGHPIPTKEYRYHNFSYNKIQDCYICPQGAKLTSNGSWYKKDTRNKNILVKHYKTPLCKNCKARPLCTKSPVTRGRVIERSNYQGQVDANNRRVEKEKDKYRLRQQMVEHPFGVIKRQWGYDHVLLKGTKKVEAELNLIFTTYNLVRVIKIIGFKELIRKLRAFSSFFGKNGLFKRFLRLFEKLVKTNIMQIKELLGYIYIKIIYIYHNKFLLKADFCTNCRWGALNNSMVRNCIV